MTEYCPKCGKPNATECGDINCPAAGVKHIETEAIAAATMLSAGLVPGMLDWLD